MNNPDAGLKYIASDLGISLTAVSRALRNEFDISDELKAKVWEKALELGYASPSIRRAKAGRTKTAALLVDSLKSPFFGLVTEMLIDCFKEKGHRILVIPTKSGTGELCNIEEAIDSNVEGIITFLDLSPVAFSLSSLYQLPVVLLGRYSELPGIGVVYFDDFDGGRKAADFLRKERNARKLVYVEVEGAEVNERRKAGFLSRAEELSIPVTVLPYEKMDEALPELLLDGYDGFFCYDDQLANYLAYRLVGRPVSIIGFNGDARYCFFPEKLPSLEADYRAMALRATGLLLSMIEGKEAEKIKFPVSLYLPGE